MIDHITLHVSDFEKSKAFYTSILSVLGYNLLADLVEHKVAGYGKERPEFWIAENPAKVGGQPHVGLIAGTKEQIHAFYEIALAHGATDNGSPGPRPEYGPTYYAAFILTPEGYNIEAALS